MSGQAHDARVRTCIVIAGIPVSELRDDIRCPACDELHRLQHLDPDVDEVLIREPWCDACDAGDKPIHIHRPGYPCVRCGERCLTGRSPHSNIQSGKDE
jgi:hypothetical protein